ncbi:acetoacetyl-CoA reductase [Telluria beijingensis]|uniref:acetoacetyl-CoA reductase n=1 Tax=Telluria beijingensis TaxID=3068633 RepID=UPI0027959CFE|nr:acetoacetyl-CoA reductase [Massilia sp. REN29]
MAGDKVEGQDRRVALVTGAMGGLGTALCRRLHAEGFLVAATHSPQNARCAAWLAEQQALGVGVRAYELDVSNGNACENVVHRVLGDVGRIDVLVNNAGITRDRSMRKMSQEDWHTVMGTNLDSVFNMTRPVLESMIERRWGRIVNISSVNGQQGAFGQANYAAAKAGMHGFTKSLALEVARHGVTVNTVSPGYLDTAMVSQVPQDVLRDRILPQIPIGRLGKPAEVAGLVAYLVSDLAGYLTGANIAINGGQHMY